MKLETKDLKGAALDYAVAIANGVPAEELELPGWTGALFRYLRNDDGDLDGRYQTGPNLLFSTKWEAGGPIIEREQITLLYRGYDSPPYWTAVKFILGQKGSNMPGAVGPTPLIAAMRCYVASKLGEEIEMPEELTM